MKPSWVLSGLVILAAAGGALALRLPRLALRPMHGDEANQAIKTADLLQTGAYRYDPEQHHGPTLYYLTLPAAWLAGERDLAQLTEGTLRVVPVVFSVGLVLLLWPLATGLGRAAAIVAAILTAISPAMVFYSRYYIQEMLLAFFTFGAIVGAWRFLTGRSFAWAIVAGACLGLMFATKETCILAFASMAVAAVLAPMWGRWVDRPGPAAAGALDVGCGVSDGDPGCGVSSPRTTSHPAGGGGSRIDRRLVLGIAVAIAAAAVIAVLFFSSFFANWRGIVDSVLAYETYFRRAAAGGLHDHPFLFYLAMLVNSRWVTGATSGPWWSEGLILALAAVGAIEALRPRRGVAAGGADAGAPPSAGPCAWTSGHAPLLRFLAFYTLALTAAYSLISYKTPWCAVQFLHGCILLAGVGAVALVRLTPARLLRPVVGLALAALAAQLGWQAYLAGYRFSADPRNPYVYAHTATDLANLVKQVTDVAAAAPGGGPISIKVITSENYWPLPWYLRNPDRFRAGYYREVPREPDGPDAAVVIASTEAEWQQALEARLRGKYNGQSLFRARPEVFWRVYVREDLWDAMLARRTAAHAARTGKGTP